jgi:hypothetical protein
MTDTLGGFIEKAVSIVLALALSSWPIASVAQTAQTSSISPPITRTEVDRLLFAQRNIEDRIAALVRQLSLGHDLAKKGSPLPDAATTEKWNALTDLWGKHTQVISEALTRQVIMWGCLERVRKSGEARNYEVECSTTWDGK